MGLCWATDERPLGVARSMRRSRGGTSWRMPAGIDQPLAGLEGAVDDRRPQGLEGTIAQQWTRGCDARGGYRHAKHGMRNIACELGLRQSSLEHVLSDRC